MSRTSPIRDSPADPLARSLASSRVFAELDDVLDACAMLAKRKQPAEDFYRQVAERVATTLAARGIGVWMSDQAMRTPNRWREIVATGVLANADASWKESLEAIFASGDNQVKRHDDAVLGPMVIVPIAPRHFIDATWLTDTRSADRPWACLAIALPQDWPPSAHDAAADFCTSLAQVAAEFHVRAMLAGAADERGEMQALMELARHAGRSLRTREVAEVIANQGRRILGCDRLSILIPRGNRARVVATSGLEQFDRKSRAVRDMQLLAAKCLRWNTPITFGTEQGDSPPDLEATLAEYADRHEVRGLSAVPVTMTTDAERPLALLLAEQFTADAEAIAPLRIQELAEAVAPALHAAASYERIPLVGALSKFSLLRSTSAMAKLLLTLAVVASVVAVLLWIERPFRVRAAGHIVPIEQSHIFSPRDAIVESILVDHGTQVSQGEVLLVLRDPALEAERTRLAGERATLESQRQALRSTRLSLSSDRSQAVEMYRLSAEEATLDLRLASLAEREALLESQIESLTIRSPRDGRVLTWKVEQQLAARPVERGQQLLLVGDTRGGWQLDLELPDRQLGYVKQAVDSGQLEIEYQLAADEREFRRAELVRIADRAREATDSLGNTTTTVELVAAPSDETARDQLQAAALRPGSHVRARLDCGDRSLGFLLFHELSRRITEWWAL